MKTHTPLEAPTKRQHVPARGIGPAHGSHEIERGGEITEPAPGTSLDILYERRWRWRW